MKNGWTLGLLALVLVIGASTATSQVTYERMLQEAELRYTKITEDGKVVASQQLERWKWFWEPRLNADGTFPTSMHYLQEIHRVNSRKRSADVQAIPSWKEVGPFAPDLPGQNNVWSGIGRVNCIAASYSNSLLLWAGSAQGGIWKTTNGGAMWQPVVVPGMPMFGVSDIAVAPSNSNIIYVATGDVDASIPGEVSGFPGFSYGMIKSTDNGVTWSPTGLTYEPAQNNLVSRIWVDPRNPDIVVAATYTGIVKSTDGGETWRSVSGSALFRDLLGNPQT